jgi:hypothetical protein
MPSPKWKLVVDIGQAGSDLTPEPLTAGTEAAALLDVKSEQEAKIPAKDPRIDQVISLLGEFMPSDPGSPNASFLPGFMSLRLMLLRPARSVEEDQLILTILGSYSSYVSSGRPRQEIAFSLSQDFTFLNSRQQQQEQLQLHSSVRVSIGQSLMSDAPLSDPTGFSFFSLPVSATDSANASFQNSPALAPIPPPNGGPDTVSIVST